MISVVMITNLYEEENNNFLFANTGRDNYMMCLRWCFCCIHNKYINDVYSFMYYIIKINCVKSLH